MYKQSVVVFLDILGFSEMVDEAKDDDSKIGSIHTALLTTKVLAGIWRDKGIGAGTESYPVKCDMFSDTVVMSCSVVAPGALFYVVESIANAQNLLIHQKCFVRGAITVGKHYQEDNLVFGPTLIHAYKMEQNLATWPRVVVDPLAFSLCGFTTEKFDALRGTMLEQDQGGIIFVNYLKMRWLTTVTEFNKNGISNKCETPPTVFAMHKDRILKAVTSPAGRDVRILARHHALARFHNDTISDICKNYLSYIGYTKELDKELEMLKKQRIDLKATFPELYVHIAQELGEHQSL
jgi:hypothetical protein